MDRRGARSAARAAPSVRGGSAGWGRGGCGASPAAGPRCCRGVPSVARAGTWACGSAVGEGRPSASVCRGVSSVARTGRTGSAAVGREDLAGPSARIRREASARAGPPVWWAWASAGDGCAGPAVRWGSAGWGRGGRGAPWVVGVAVLVGEVSGGTPGVPCAGDRVGASAGDGCAGPAVRWGSAGWGRGGRGVSVGRPGVRSGASSSVAGVGVSVRARGTSAVPCAGEASACGGGAGASAGDGCAGPAVPEGPVGRAWGRRGVCPGGSVCKGSAGEGVGAASAERCRGVLSSARDWVGVPGVSSTYGRMRSGSKSSAAAASVVRALRRASATR
ncbi:hypothetical protein SCNRRL3882_5616 [Streptomyces chartreusis NRRL 3882]|uniref:Uncharacterized protein n=1 Tax=Streptomyces chartreusis NRRL 3882 TaxID=1079985 RepID=A0A2N9BFP0_STRCX|nr:hypothetical protein SCNRRL3882_5616 [Streptomyces chartreusis NRRL 3882]